MASGDKEIPPASEDDWVQTFLDDNWRTAMAGVDKAMEALRSVWPTMVVQIPETGGNHIKRALDSIESAYENLHAAGPHVLGSVPYNSYLDKQTESKIERQ